MVNTAFNLCKLEIIKALINGERLGLRELSLRTNNNLNVVKEAITDLNDENKFGGIGLLKEILDKYEIILDDKKVNEAKIIAEVISDILEVNKALIPLKLVERVKDITSNRFGQKQILDIAKWLDEKNMFGVSRRTLWKEVKGKYWSRHVFCNIKYINELDYFHVIKPKEKERKIKLEGAEQKFEKISDFIEHLKHIENYKGQILHIEPPKQEEAKTSELDFELNPLILNFLKQKKIYPFYTHQASAINNLRKGENALVTTPNASGKTLCYLVPIFEQMLKNHKSTVLYISPTKALAQDQLKRFLEFEEFLNLNVSPSTYDGDTPKKPKSIRENIRKKSEIILTNPDMLHIILSFHTEWENFFRNLKFIVLDEMHIYSGIFGSHVANIIRRLRRICSYYGSSPQFIGLSATIANPEELAQKLTGLKFTLINNNGTPIWPKYFVFWNPPLDDENGERLSPYTEAIFLFKEHVKHGLQNITFTLARKITELILKKSKKTLADNIASRIKSYRAGIPPEVRREIEGDLKSGTLLGVTSTNALELGVDIGNLDATILVGYPGSIASTWQQANRAGRRNREALTTLIALDDPLNQYLITHPQEFFSKPTENAIIDPDNEYVFADHVVCAASELSLEENERVFGKKLQEYLLSIPEPKFYNDKEYCPECDAVIIQNMTEKGNYCNSCFKDLLIKKGDKWFSTKKGFHRNISIRGSASWQDKIIIKDINATDSEKNIGDSEKNRAIAELHEGAVYLYLGEDYLVNELNLDNKIAYVQYTPQIGYYTEPLKNIIIKPIKTHQSKEINNSIMEYSELFITETITGFVKIREDEKGKEQIEEVELEPNSTTMKTFGMWIKIPDELKVNLNISEEEFNTGLHAVEHLLSNLAPKFAICDRRDINSVTLGTKIYIYDNIPGGVGLSEKVFEMINDLFLLSYEIVKNCKCKTDDGCPSCIQSSFCEKMNNRLNKNIATKILKQFITKEESVII